MSTFKPHLDNKSAWRTIEPARAEEIVSSDFGMVRRTLSSTSLVRSIGINTFYQIISQVVPAIAAILSLPYLFRHLGSEAFGIMTIFSAGLVYFTMLDLGLGRSVTRFVAQSLEAGRLDEVRAYFWGSISLLAIVGGIATTACLLGVPKAVEQWLRITPAYSHVASESFYIIVFTIPLITLVSTFRGLLEAWGRFPLISAVTACSGIGLYLFPVLAIWMGGGLVAVACSIAAVRIGMCCAFALGCIRIPGRPSLRPTFKLQATKRMLSFGGWLSVSSIVGTTMVYGDRFLLGISSGVITVASYGVALDVISKIQILITSFCAVLFPIMSRLDESGSAHFDRIYRGAVALALSVMTPLTLALVLAAPFLMRVWLGPRCTPDTIFAAQVFLAGAVVQAGAAIAFTALHARGRSDWTAWIHLLEFPIYIGLFYWAAVHFGTRGAVLIWLGRMVVDFLCMAVVFRIHKRDGGLLPPELVAAGISMATTAVMVLAVRNSVLVAVTLCIITWLWSWHALLDHRTRLELTTFFNGWRAFRRCTVDS